MSNPDCPECRGKGRYTRSDRPCPVCTDASWCVNDPGLARICRDVYEADLPADCLVRVVWSDAPGSITVVLRNARIWRSQRYRQVDVDVRGFVRHFLRVIENSY